jgi:uncharacterized damage-inducible protein DinB
MTLLQQSCAAAVPPLIAVMRQLGALVEALTDEQYQARPFGALSGSIGGHVRHCLDHVAALAAAPDGALDYDRRERGTAVETDRAAALEALRRHERRLLALPAGAEMRPLRLTAIVSPGRPPVEAGTTLGRELAFVLSHTVHHNALVAVLAAALGVTPPQRFGYAPATLDHLEKAACRR